MGRMKVFLRSFCLNGCVHRSNDPTYDSGIDVSHLATPHLITPHITGDTSRKATPILDYDGTDNQNYSVLSNHTHQSQTPSSCALPTLQQQQQQANGANSNLLATDDHDDAASSNNRPISISLNNSQRHENNESHPSPAHSSPSHNQENLYNEVLRSRDTSTPDLPPLHQLQQQQQQQQRRSYQSNQSHNIPILPVQNQPQLPSRDPPTSNSSADTSTAKLSYDIISVREPLAKILAERQQLLAQQQQQRQLIGDHEYIEVYGERGSSCFYEEIAGSVTSSATYDQIGAVSNHNYQVLVSAYAGLNSRNNLIRDRGSGDDRNVEERAQAEQENDPAYDVTNPPDQVDGSRSVANPTNESSQPETSEVTNPVPMAQSVAIYSVINKANKRSSSNMRSLNNDISSDRPPRPPPKNLVNYNQTGAIHNQNEQYNHNASCKNNCASSPSRSWAQTNSTPSTSSFKTNTSVENHITNEAHSNYDSSMLTHIPSTTQPQPPPRLVRHLSGFNNATDRPLPSPDSMNNNNGSTIDRNLALVEYDIESLNNGYELLRSNLDDDQFDVGYEKIRDNNRYSGGSITSQFNPLQLIDNGGYESVQPIYSSPSMVEPNYEAIAPTTAAELAAAATAKLNAAATVIEQTRNSSQMSKSTII